jgi:asparagine synthase (glutamine-hydrolysing)
MTAAGLLRSRAQEPHRTVSSIDGTAAAGVTGAIGSDVLALAAPDLLVAAEGRFDELVSLRRDLGLDSTAPIARILAESYMLHGDGFVNRLRGDFAFAIWDGPRQRILAARDPFGIRPLHYASRDGQLCIASDVDQMLEGGFAQAIPDDQMVVEFLTRDFRSLDRSFIKGVSRLPPGHVLVVTSTQTSISDYRQIPTVELSFSSTEDYHEAFREKFFTAVERRISSGKPVAVQLSGGVDSTSIVCAADVLLNRNSPGIGSVVSASATFTGLSCDESRYLDAVEKHVRIPILRWDGRLANGVEFSEPLLAAPGNRVPWSSGTEGYVAIARSQGATTVVDGTGGDQIGMPLGTETDEVTLADWRWVAQYLRRSGFSASRGTRVLRWAVGAALPPWIRRSYRRARGQLRPRDVPNWLVGTASSRVHEDSSVTGQKRRLLSNSHRLRWATLSGAPLAMSIDAKQRHASWSGLELAFPFLDWDLIQFIFATPAKHWPPPRWLARIHREALRPYLPPAVYLRREKAEFTPAMTNRVRRNLSVIVGLIEGKSWRSERFVDQDGARGLLRRFQKAPTPNFVAVYHLWAIASVEAWLNRILSYGTSAA